MTTVTRSRFSVAGTGMALLVGLSLLFVLAACMGTTGRTGSLPTASTGTAAPGSVQADGPGAETPPPDWSGSTVSVGEIPWEAVATLGLVAADGPYPYSQDGSTFQNREGILPERPAGFYREFTVETPGSPDRGARRLVVGEDFSVYYTDDHYESFRFVAR